MHKTFRRRPKRLLNVLCTFSLRPVSTGNKFPKSSSLGIVEPLTGASLGLEVTRLTEIEPDLKIDFK